MILYLFQRENHLFIQLKLIQILMVLVYRLHWRNLTFFSYFYEAYFNLECLFTCIVVASSIIILIIVVNEYISFIKERHGIKIYLSFYKFIYPEKLRHLLLKVIII